MVLEEGPLRKFLRERQKGREDPVKEYDPHVIVVWTSPNAVAVQEYPYKEDAEEKYNDVVQAHAQKVVLAKIIKSHGEG